MILCSAHGPSLRSEGPQTPHSAFGWPTLGTHRVHTRPVYRGSQQHAWCTSRGALTVSPKSKDSKSSSKRPMISPRRAALNPTGVAPASPSGPGGQGRTAHCWAHPPAPFPSPSQTLSIATQPEIAVRGRGGTLSRMQLDAAGTGLRQRIGCP